MELVNITVKCACGHIETAKVNLDEVGFITSEMEADVCTTCKNEAWEIEADRAIEAYEEAMERQFVENELRVCQVCSKVVTEESHCTQVTGPYDGDDFIDDDRDDLSSERAACPIEGTNPLTDEEHEATRKCCELCGLCKNTNKDYLVGDLPF